MIQIVTSLERIVEDLRKEGVDGYFTVTVTPPKKPKTLATDTDVPCATSCDMGNRTDQLR